ncbi:hypothetical protein CLOSTASPAR_01358 [[Clostridium] asparagiforme DSM 15981]|uniref:Uncharacterized protein n=1 Tax=[Clostridium] asparagiforme DSM 15981 TaxID=518636 RepID=C0CWJ2_9FIRM|nr:hypothetical protein CLOSTASPAR_01358 [[Clostridium] asparagiforme DSM 15981]
MAPIRKKYLKVLVFNKISCLSCSVYLSVIVTQILHSLQTYYSRFLRFVNYFRII